MNVPRRYKRMERKLKKVGMAVVVFAIVITSFHFYKTETTLIPAIDKRNKILAYREKNEVSGHYASAFPKKTDAKKRRKKDDYTEETSNDTLSENYSGFAGNSSNDIENELFFLSEYDKIVWGNVTNPESPYHDNNFTEVYRTPEKGILNETDYDETTSGLRTNPKDGLGVTRTSDGLGVHVTSDVQKDVEPTSPSSDDFGVDPEEDPSLDDRREEFARRASVVRDVCRQFQVRENATATELMSNIFQGVNNLDTYVEYVSSDNFILARSASTMTCLINKVASTSVAVALLQADGRPLPEWTETLSPHNAAVVLKPMNQVEFHFARKHFFKFLLVRHPFERLLSAYRDKVERADHWSLRELRQHIANSLREAQQQRTPERSPPTAGSRGTNEQIDVKEQPDDSVPTFADFLEYILTTNLSDGGFDSHWAPYWRTCSPCSVNYNVIAKLETADQDLKPVWRRMGLLQWTNLPRYNRSGAGGSLSLSETVDQYYRTLHPSLIARVYRRFVLDFHLFQYDIMDVFRRGGHCQTYDCKEMTSYL